MGFNGKDFMQVNLKWLWIFYLVSVVFFEYASVVAMDDINFADDIDIPLNVIDDFENTHVQTRVLRPFEQDLCIALQALCNAVNGSVWNKTELPMGRNILYLLPYKIAALEYGGLAVNLFFNMTDNMGVSAYNLLRSEALNNNQLVSIMQLFNMNNIPAHEIASLVQLFRRITIQERRAGSLLQAGFIKGPFTVQFNTSFHLAERNFWLSKNDQQAISDIWNNIQRNHAGGGGQNVSSEHVGEREFYQMRFGMGDSRLKVGMNTLNMPNFQIDVGGESIIPTSRFSYAPHLNVKTVQDIDVSNMDNLKKDLVDLVRGVRDYLINPRMGNNGHFGLGFYVESKANIFKGFVQLWTRVSFDKLFANDEDRLMMFRIVKPKDQIRDDAESTRRRDADAEMPARRQDAKDFVQQYLFPTLFKTTVCPGGVFNAVLGASFDIKKMKFSLGYDFYAQQAEHIESIHNTSISMQSLRVEDAEVAAAYQHKVFTEALYFKKFKRSTVGLGLGGDVTVATKGIGYDWTTYVKLTAAF